MLPPNHTTCCVSDKQNTVSIALSCEQMLLEEENKIHTIAELTKVKTETEFSLFIHQLFISMSSEPTVLDSQWHSTAHPYEIINDIYGMA